MKPIPVAKIRRVGSERLGTAAWFGVLKCGCAFGPIAQADEPKEASCRKHPAGLPVEGKPKKG